MNSIVLRSVLVVLGAAFLAVVLAAILALATFGRNRWFSRFQAGMVNCVLLLPSYVVAGAWSAGFGAMGWWTLSQVTAAKAPLVGLASVVWVHAMAATPLAFGLLTIGLQRCSGSMVELAKMEGGPRKQLVLGILPTWSVWSLGVFFLVAAWVSGDMVVTNLFQVNTLTEQCYLDSQADVAKWSHRIAASSLSVGLGFVGVVVLRRVWTLNRRERQPGSSNSAPLGPDWIGSVVGALVTGLVVGVPLANLIIRSGWLATELDSGSIQRSWNARNVLTNALHAPTEFQEEFGWSLSLSAWSASLACLLGASLVLWRVPPFVLRFRRDRYKGDLPLPKFRGIFFVAMITAVALPGPIVCGLVIEFFQLPILGLAWLNDHTLAAPILCLQFRLLPIAVLAIAILDRHWQDRVGDVWQIDRDRRWINRFHVYFSALKRPIFAVWILLFAIAFGDLSSYLQCLPPGVTPVSMRIFDLLHYGVRSSEAGLLLFIAIVGAVMGLLVLPRIH